MIKYSLFALLVSLALSVRAQTPAASADIRPLLDSYNVSWDVPGPGPTESMPIGNGDIGLNVWVEPSGDVCFYIGKTDSWSEDPKGSKGLVKLGAVRLALSPSPLTAGSTFRQVLKLHEGDIQITEGTGANAVALRLWVDANNPVIRAEIRSAKPVSVTATLDDWRKTRQGGLSADVIMPAQANRVTWYHRNGANSDPHVLNLTFGGVIKGQGLVSKDASTLQSSSPTKTQLVSIYPLTVTTDTPAEWVTKLDDQIGRIEALNFDQTRQAHEQWWDQFWHRSWIFIEGEKNAHEVTEGYLLQRFVTACAGRGAYPMKFNGSIFNTAYPNYGEKKDKAGKDVDADYRTWGGQYWFQNTRAMYWPRLQAGDFDVLMPLFKMYAAMIPANAEQVKGYYHHDGVYFAETAPWWGSLKYVGPEVPENWTDHYFTPILELSMMMLDYYDYTGDKSFAKEILLPVASGGITFFDQHFKRDADGKLLLDPDNAIEMYWKVHNPAPDIGGLRAVLPRLIALPDDLVTASERTEWKRLYGELPPLPTTEKRGKKLLLPYTGPQTAKSRNGENPELYAVYPFRLYGLERPDLPLAIDTFFARRCTSKGCWVQDPIQAAMLGLSDVAREYVTFNFMRKDPLVKFPAFWANANDYIPDEDNGGNGENGLQTMLLQNAGRKILLLPAWPKDWNVQFKLNAPYRTIVEGKFVDGKLVDLVVTPASRRADVIDMSTRPAWTEPAPKPFVANGNVINRLSSQDEVVALQQTVAGAPNVIDEAANADGQSAHRAIDGNLGSKYFNRSRDGGNTPGANTGLVIVPKAGAQAFDAIQIGTANDMRVRDPYSITVEGSNAPDAAAAGGNGYTLLYEGEAGLEADPGRQSWGQVVRFKNTTAYKAYRILVTDTQKNTDATQYAEVRLGNTVTP
ncbi:MAG TPA: DUF5703 domain-containing protein [Rariglobus sp.]|nr:DUF5703 domain-containing protein [Rariglobus sp.]